MEECKRKRKAAQTVGDGREVRLLALATTKSFLNLLLIRAAVRDE